MTLWASTDLEFLDLPPEQPFPFYYRTDRLRLFYPVTPDFWEWLRAAVAVGLRRGPVPLEEMSKVIVVDEYVSKTYPGIPGEPKLPEAQPAEERAALERFVDGNDRWLKAPSFVAWRPMA